MAVNCASNSLEALRKSLGSRLEALEGKNSSRLLFSGILDGTSRKISLLRTALSAAKSEDEMWEVWRAMAKVEQGLDKGMRRALLVRGGILSKSGAPKRFFDYLLEEEMPEEFVERALGFREETAKFGITLLVDGGIVYAKSRFSSSAIVGHLVRTFISTPSVHSEYPIWKRRGCGERADGVSCSIKLDNVHLGITNTDVRSFVYARMTLAEDFSQSTFTRLEGMFRIGGFAIELNEDGERVHIYFYTPVGQRLTSTLFCGKLQVPPEAWLKPPEWMKN